MRLIVNVSDDQGRVIYSADADIETAIHVAVNVPHKDRLALAREAVTQVAERIADGTD